MINPQICPGGGATEISLAVHLTRKSKTVEGVEQWPYGAVGIAMEVLCPN